MIFSAMTMDSKEMTHHAIQLEKLHKNGDYEEVSSLLLDLNSRTVTLEQLQSTDIARIVYQLLKSCPVSSVRRTAKGLLSKWKKQYGSQHEHKNSQTKECEPESKAEAPLSVPKTQPHLERKVNDGQIVECSQSSVDSDQLSSEGPILSKKTQGTLSVLPPQPSSSTDSTALRNKCVELLLQALNPAQKTDSEDASHFSTIAQAIENNIYALHGQNQVKYKSCLRSRLANLKNSKNPHLRQGLLTGTLAPEVFTRMSVEEMAGEELRRLRQGYTEAAISEHQLPQGLEGTTTTKVRCRRCQGMDCRVTQIPRGTLFLPSWVKGSNADEQAMTFMTCAGCGEQWYHNRWVCL